MKVGDLVRIKQGRHYPARRHMGIVVRDMTMMCSGSDARWMEPYRMGEIEVLWNDGTTARATYANLEVIK